MTEPTLVVNYDETRTAIYSALVAERGYRFMWAEAYETDAAAAQAVLPKREAVVDYGTLFGRTVISTDSKTIISLEISNRRAAFSVAGNTLAARDAAIATIKKHVPVHAPSEDRSLVDVKFWTTGSNGPRSITRSIAAPTFETIERNYAESARSPLGHMMNSDFKPGAGGQLLLWWGPPGGGKTYALRALAQSWRDWCDIEYVVDPEQFFGDATYLMPVLLNMSASYSASPASGEERWRLLVFEDTGELLSADARTRAGQGLSRLLNVVDGFIGQGLRTLILITTNEEIDKLHPAVSRPGRCAVKAHFGSLSWAEAREWAKANNVSLPRGEYSLAELYALRDGFRNDEGTAGRPIGFQMGVVA